MSKKQTTIPAIEELKLDSLTIDTRYSGRTDREIKANSRELAPVMEAHGFWDVGQPGQYFEADGKKVLCAGFTRYETAKSLGYKVGYFTKTDDPKVTLLLKCVTTNQGKPVSPWKQGERFAQLRTGDTQDSLQVGEEVLAPMTVKEIAAAVGKSEQHIRNCVAIFESSPEIAELIESGAVSANVVTRVQQLAKEPGKQLKIVKASIHAAKEDDKETATMKHLDAIKDQFAEPKKLKAVASPETESKPAAETGNATNDTPETGAPQSNPESASTQPIQSLADLGGDKETVSKKKTANYRRSVIEAIAGWIAASPDVGMSEEDIQSLADAIVKVSCPF